MSTKTQYKNIEELKNSLLKDIKKLKSPDGYLNAGYPNYDTLFGRDSLISAWQMLPIYPEIASNTLNILAKYQAKEYDNKKEAEPGKILHEYRFDPEKQAELPEWGWPYYGSIDSTSLFIIVAGKYYEETKDKDLIESIWVNLENAVKWHIKKADEHPNGFIAYNPLNPHGLVHQGWRDALEDHLNISPPPIAIVEKQGYTYLAYLTFYKLAKLLKKEDKQLQQKVLKYTDNLKKEFDKVFWVPEKKFFALGINGEGEKNTSISSNPGHLLLCEDFIDDKKSEAVKNRLFEEDIFTIGGIRTHAKSEPDFDGWSYHMGSVWPHDNWMIYKGLLDKGFNKEAQKIKECLLRAYTALGCIPELYAVEDGEIMHIKNIEQLNNNNKKSQHLRSLNANHLQAWASAALLNMIWEK